jgi:probable phosphoglycerate mutase
MNIILARHGETEWNVAEVFRGRIDIELNEMGLKQAELLGEYLSHMKIEAVYSGPLKRALQVAQAIARYQGFDVKISDGLLDMNFGKWEGLPRQEVAEKYKESFTEWMRHPDRVKIPGGESLADVRQRATALIDEIIAKHQGTVVLVTHRVVTKVLICALLGLDDSHFWNIEQSTCGITTFNYRNGQFILTEHNNTSFLKPLSQKKLADF